MPASDPLPFATATIARLCLLQGRLDQAEALYRQLLAEEPKDPRLLEGLADVLRRRQDAELPPSADRVELGLEGELLRCRWRITEEGERRARLVLEAPGQRVLRLVSFPSDPKRPPQDTRIEALSGELSLPRPAGAALLGVAVGYLGEGGRFVSVAHATTPGEATPQARAARPPGEAPPSSR